MSATDIVLTWTEPLEDQINGIIRSYDIKLIELDTSAVIFKNTSNTEITVTSLHPYYRYEISVAAVTIERGPFSLALSITTEQAGIKYFYFHAYVYHVPNFWFVSAPSGSPTSVSVVAINSTSLNISWDLPLVDQINGIIEYYSVRVQVSETAETFNYKNLPTSLVLTGLHPYYTYTVFVAANTISIGPYSTGISIQTPADSELFTFK